MTPRESKKILKLIEKAIKIFPQVVRDKERAYREREKILKNFLPFSRQLKKIEEKANPPKIHPWRTCPIGEHWVNSHPLTVPVSTKNPEGITLRDGHCRANRSKKDQLHMDEIRKISDLYFDQSMALPKPDNLDISNGNQYDKIIGGWTKYWNEILKPNVLLDPNLVKALIKTESDFNEAAKVLASKENWARGLMQLTDQTVAILKNEKGELRDHLIDVDSNEILDPRLNICAGIRWLFHKKNLLEKRLRRPVSWSETVMEYKAYTKKLKKGHASAIEQRSKFLETYERLRK